MPKHWYKFRSKDKKVQGYVPRGTKAEVARLAGYPLEKLVIKRVIYDGKEFVECQETK